MSDDDGTSLAGLVGAMEQTWASIIELAESLAPEDWTRPTRCPGWDVHDQVAHVVSLEQLLAGGPLAPEAPSAPHIRNPVGAHMERGVHALRGTPPAELVTLLQAVVHLRTVGLQLNPPTVGSTVLGAMGNQVPAESSLPIRVFDLWTHEQDIRAAVGRPGNEDGPGARISQEAILSAVPKLWGKDAGATVGQTLRVTVRGALPLDRTVVVGADGRARWTDSDADAGDESTDDDGEPTAAIELSWADLAARACGREGAADSPVRVGGDATMAEAVLAGWAMSP